MPKVYLTKNQEREDKVRKIINYAKADGILKKEMYEELGLSSVGFGNKQNNPGTFTLEEIWKLMDFLKVPNEKRAEILL